jgi:hypothetical protein
MKWKSISIIAISVFCGILIGGYLFSHTQPRSFVMLNKCESQCFSPNELVGLLASLGIQHAPGLVPNVVAETDRSIAFVHPAPQAPIHYVIVPKKDIKDAGDIGEGERPYLIDAYDVMRTLIHQEQLQNYQIITNGPGIQQMRYLHFHLMSE